MWWFCSGNNEDDKIIVHVSYKYRARLSVKYSYILGKSFAILIIFITFVS